MKVIYACPFSHYSGHHPHVATVEPKTLKGNGIDAILLTFCGVTNDPDVGVEHHTVMPKSRLLVFIRKFTILRYFIMLFETFATLAKAIYLYKRKKADAIIVRDGEPFLFTSFLLSFPFKNQRWIISLTAANLVAPKASISQFRTNPFLTIYTVVMNLFINNRIWTQLYKHAMKRNKYILCPQNEMTRVGYSEYMNGVFKDNLHVIPWGRDNNIESISKEEARKFLDIPEDAKVILSFGAPHSGKDLETVFKALVNLSNIYFVHGGIQAFSLGSSPIALQKKYNIEKCKVFNYYIPENEKKYFFYAADVAILSYYKIFQSTSSMLWECSQYKLPVISSDANTLGNRVREMELGILFEAENPKSLEDAVNKYFSLRQDEINKFKERESEFLKEYSASKWANKYKEALEMVGANV